jgi:hypothetical protein
MKLKLKGRALESVLVIIFLVVGVSVATISQTMGTAISAKGYKVVEGDINSITDATIKSNATGAVQSAFAAQKTNADFIPLMILGVVFFVIISLLFQGVSNGLGGGGLSV